jgi:hypothetical protein
MGSHFPRSIEGLHGAAIPEGLQNLWKTFDFKILQELIRQGMNTFLLGFLFGRNAVKLLEEPGEAHDMNELMGDNISCEGEKLDVSVTLDSLSDHVILDANFEEFPSLAPSQSLMRRLGIAMYLSECGVDDFFFMQVLQRLNIITVTLPFRCGNLVKIADEFFRNGYGMSQYLDLFLVKRIPLHVF